MLVSSTATGLEYDLEDVAMDASVVSTKAFLEDPTGVPVADQIWITAGGARMDDKRTLAFYAIDSPDPALRVFLYDRRVISGAKPDVLAKVAVPAWSLPAAPPAAAETPLAHRAADAGSPLVRAMLAYEREFHARVERAALIARMGKDRLDWCRRCVAAQYVQADGLDAALKNLRFHWSKMTDKYKAFSPKVEQATSRHAKMLGTFEADIGVLSSTKILPQLDAPYATLVDFVPVDDLRSFYKAFAENHAKLATQIRELGSAVAATSEGVGTELDRKAGVKHDMLETELAEAANLLEEEEALLARCEAHYESVRKTVDGALEGKQSDGALGNMGQMDSLLDELTGELESARKKDVLLHTCMEMCAHEQDVLAHQVHERLRTNSSLQSRIRTVLRHMQMVTMWVDRHTENYKQLVIIQRIPISYRALLREILRRRSYGVIYAQHVSAINDRMARLRDAEMSKRASFMKKHGRYLPKELTRFLLGALPIVEFDTPELDTQMPMIDPGEVEEITGRVVGAMADAAASAPRDASVDAADGSSTAASPPPGGVMANLPRSTSIDGDDDEDVPRFSARTSSNESHLRSLSDPSSSIGESTTLGVGNDASFHFGPNPMPQLNIGTASVANSMVGGSVSALRTQSATGRPNADLTTSELDSALDGFGRQDAFINKIHEQLDQHIQREQEYKRRIAELEAKAAESDRVAELEKEVSRKADRVHELMDQVGHLQETISELKAMTAMTPAGRGSLDGSDSSSAVAQQPLASSQEIRSLQDGLEQMSQKVRELEAERDSGVIVPAETLGRIAETLEIRVPQSAADMDALVHSLFVLSSTKADLASTVEQLQRSLKDQEELQEDTLRQTSTSLAASGEHSDRMQTIAVSGFAFGDRALFYRVVRSADGKTGEKERTHHFMAFNVGAPNYFIDAAAAAALDTDESIVAICATIVLVDDELAVSSGNENPFGLGMGERFHVVHIESDSAQLIGTSETTE